MGHSLSPILKMKNRWWVLMMMWVVGLAACTESKTVGAAHPDEAAVRAFLERYFSTWSAQDMAGYEGCFTPEARITYVAPDGKLSGQGLTDFIHSQRMAHAQSAAKMVEVPLEMQISGDALVAQAGVKWQLTKGASIETGLDYFTLRKAADGWRIVSLVFYQDP